METVVLFDPSIKSFNKGDEIIFSSVRKELSNILNDKMVIRCATHAPVITSYQNTMANPEIRKFMNAKYKFICGSNLLWKNMLVPRPSWNINFFNSKPYEDSILMGVGTGLSFRKTNLYTKKLYKKILSNKFIHSVRDEATVKFLESLNIKAIDTGCPTMWRFTEDFCRSIPHTKSDKCVFTLTDYGKNYELDQKLINTLKDEYSHIYFWIQGSGDYEYFSSFENINNIEIIPPSVSAFDKFLSENKIDYIGTRLHAGMFALQHKQRSIMIAIDNRVRDIGKSYNIHYIEREDIEKNLKDYINKDFETNVHIKINNISRWLHQFE